MRNKLAKIISCSCVSIGILPALFGFLILPYGTFIGTLVWCIGISITAVGMIIALKIYPEEY